MNKERLLKLAEHLETGKLGHKIFDFAALNTGFGDGDPATLAQCGTNGCAIGECPVVFPQEWNFDARGLPRTRDSKARKETILPSFSDARSFFDIREEECDLLFTPQDYPEECDLLFTPQDYPDGNSLPGGATRYQVAAHIRLFVKQKLEQENLRRFAEV